MFTKYAPNGLPYQITDNGTTIEYSYYGDGKIMSTKVGGNNNTKIEYTYDANRHPNTMSDPSLGLRTYSYNAFGELISETNNKGQTTNYSYDALGRMTSRTDEDGTTTWQYDQQMAGLLDCTVYEPTDSGEPSVRETFEYDQHGRLIHQNQLLSRENRPLEFTYEYNKYGQRKSITYPSGYALSYSYDQSGNMLSVKNSADGSVLWSASSTDKFGNITNFTLGSNINVGRTYDSQTGLVASLNANSGMLLVQSMQYQWNDNKGNLTSRTDNTTNHQENFTYDNYNRLTNIEIDGNNSRNITYDNLGNVSGKYDAGSMIYNSGNPYAVKKIYDIPNICSYDGAQDITYTSFDKVKSISQGTKTLNVSYGADRQRVRQTLNIGNSTKTKQYFTPLYEVVNESGTNKKIHYLTSSTGLFAIFALDSNNNGTMSYVIKDHQGSMYATVTGNTVERYSFDAWGRRRNPQTLSYDNVTASFDRGYTLHEHYDDFGLINMNGRLYDPLIARMLSPDIVIQDEQNSQAYNRYSYCFNNPLRYTDPSGYIVRGSYYLFSRSTILFYENHDDKGVFFNTDEALGLQFPKIEPFGEEEKEAYMAYRNEVFSYDTEEYKAIQAELIRLENAEEIFRIRMGKNITSKAGGGNFIYNKETGEFDVNIANYGDFNIMGKMAHELKHADQYMIGELAFDIRGDAQFGKPIAYDIYDEIEAFYRQGILGKTLSENEIYGKYNKLNQTHINMDNIIMPYNKEQIIGINNHKITKKEHIRFIYYGWEKDIKQ